MNDIVAGLPNFLKNSLKSMGIDALTEVQRLAIPSILDGKDSLVSSHTGSGKTLAYLIPIIVRIAEDFDSKTPTLILAPTRELASQIGYVARKCVKGSTIKVALLIGGQPITSQFRQLSENPRIIVGTPGRVNDHIAQKTFDPTCVDCFVLDEVDRMLDMGFCPQIQAIESLMSKRRQTLMLSATLLPRTMSFIKKCFHGDFLSINDGSANKIAPKIDHSSEKVSPCNKFDRLVKQLEKREGSVLVFVNKKLEAKRLAVRLRASGYSADSIHGDLRQSARDRVVRMFRQQKTRIIVGTDVIARGLDVSHVRHVINYDLPVCPEDYLHRIGRTGRAGEPGSAFSMIAPQEGKKWLSIKRLVDPAYSNSECEFTFSGNFLSKVKRSRTKNIGKNLKFKDRGVSRFRKMSFKKRTFSEEIKNGKRIFSSLRSS